MRQHSRVLRGLAAAMVMLTSLCLAGCDLLKSYPKHIQEFPGPWQMIDPGKPLEKFPRVEILEQGRGSFTYTPKQGWSGKEDLAFKASDGLVEADGVVRIAIHVQKPKP